MTKRLDGVCPLCLSPSTFALFDYGQRKAYDCPACGQFVITQMAADMLNKPPGRKEQQMAHLSKRAGAGRIAEIRTEPSHDGGGKHLTIRIVERGLLPLP